MTASLFVPGRLCLFGEHSDWAGAYRTTHPHLAPGRCLVAGTDQGLAATARAAADVVITSVLPDGTRRALAPTRATVADLDAVAREGAFFSYAAGVVAEMLLRFGAGGLLLDIVANDLPLGKGLSSSAAVCVLVARAYAAVHGIALDVREEMALAYAGERRTGSQCGLMDQVCAYGRTTTHLTFDGTRFEVERSAVGGPLALLVVDLGRTKDTRRILADLNACFPEAPGAVAAGVREALGRTNARIVGAAREALGRGDARGLGTLMSEAQAVFDAQVAPACPELRAPRLHQVLAHPASRELAWGGKGVGSQGDGSAQLVARSVEARAALAARLTGELGVVCLPLTVG